MWDKHNEQFHLEVVEMIINGNEVAVHHRNCIKGTNAVIDSIETYRFELGHLSVVYFLKPRPRRPIRFRSNNFVALPRRRYLSKPSC